MLLPEWSERNRGTERKTTLQSAVPNFEENSAQMRFGDSGGYLLIRSDNRQDYQHAQTFRSKLGLNIRLRFD